MSNLSDPTELTADGLRVARVAERAGAEHLGDTNEVGIFDAGRRAQRRFGARFDVADALGDYGGRAQLVPPAPGPHQTQHDPDMRRFP
jgi:hypothetical protein